MPESNLLSNLTNSQQAGVWFAIVFIGLWLLVGIPILIGLGWNRTSNASNSSQQSIADLMALTETAIAQQNNAVQSNFIASMTLPPGTVNIGGADEMANALTFTGDVTLDEFGEVKVRPGAIQNSQLANPAKYIVSTFPPDLPPVPVWRNSLTTGFYTGALFYLFPFHTCGFAVSVIVRNVPSTTSTPTPDVDSQLIDAGDRFRLALRQNNVLSLVHIPTATTVVEAPVTQSVANRAAFTIFSFSQSFVPGDAGGWVYTLFADNLIIASNTVPAPYDTTGTGSQWSFCKGSTSPLQELAGAYIFFAANPNDPTLTTADLEKLVVIGPGNTFSSKLNAASLAAYELYNTPGYPDLAANSGKITQSYTSTISPFTLQPFPITETQAGLTWSLYKNESLAMLQPQRFSSVFVNFSMPANVTTVTITILIEVVVPYLATNLPDSEKVTLVFYGPTVGEDIYNVDFEVLTDVREQTLVASGIPTTANPEIGQKWTAELVRNDIAASPPNVFWIGVKNFVVEGDVP